MEAVRPPRSYGEETEDTVTWRKQEREGEQEEMGPQLTKYTYKPSQKLKNRKQALKDRNQVFSTGFCVPEVNISAPGAHSCC